MATTATKQGPTVRISTRAHQTLRQLSADTGEPMHTVLDKAREQYRRQRFFEELDAAYAAIQADPDALAEEMKERALWDNTLMDGLDPKEIWAADGTMTHGGKFMAKPAYGEVWFGDLDPTVGHEQAGRRPLLVVSPDAFNQNRLGLSFVVPITSNLRSLPSRVAVSPPEGGLTLPSMILCEAMRPFSQDRLERFLGVVSPQTMKAVQDRLRILLNL